MKSYIHTYATISRVNSFEDGILQNESIEVHAETVHPGYKDYISPALIRRMSPVVKMGVTAGLKCLEGQGEIGGVIVGTDLGCLRDTEKFLGTVVKHEGLAISPTAFIQSTHNTVAGQIALTIGNNGYNMTHSQQGISFECALMDARLLTAETKLPVLVGACEEHIDFLSEMATDFGAKQLDLSEGATYFLISDKQGEAKTAVTVVQIGLSKEEITHLIVSLQPELVLTTSLTGNPIETSYPTIDFTSYCGVYGTNPAFGLQLAAEILEKQPSQVKGKPLTGCNKIAIINNHRDKEMTWMVVERVY
jgi:3-oxoacyl-[acyl-carrier-protein] synthase II